MRAEDTLQYMMDFHPSIFYNRQQCLNQLFCVIGNGYDWINGELADEDCEYLTRWTLKKPIEYAKPSSMCEFQMNSIIPMEKRLGNKIEKWYPLCKSAYLFNYPMDIKEDWLSLIKECKQMLIADGIDINNVDEF